MRASSIKLEAFNNCPGADAVRDRLRKYNLSPYIQVIDLEHSQRQFFINSGDTLVVAILNGPNQLQTALALGNIAASYEANEFTWTVIDGTYVVRLWWD